MRIRKLIWILAGCCLLSGCRSGNANLSEKMGVILRLQKNLQRAGKKPNRTFRRGFKRMSAKMFI